MKICFTGDLFLGGDLVQNKDSIIRSPSFFNSDLRVVNIEQAISDNDLNIEKGTLYSSSDILNLLDYLKIDVASLANNHIQDKGEKGIYDTLKHLQNKNVRVFGAGKNLPQAEKPLWINDELCLLGYCEHSMPYLNKVQISDEFTSGVNPFSYKKVLNDLVKIPDKAKAIIHLHWGREHVALPDAYHIDIAEKLLEHPKVALVVGMHSHRIQGAIKRANKKAYLSLGNFLFPNFYIEPRTQISYPSESNQSNVRTTKDYHFVGELTYKIWRLVNRISMIVVFDTETGKLKEVPVYQKKHTPEVIELEGFNRGVVLAQFKALSLFYRLPPVIYNPIQYTYRQVKKLIRFTYVGIFLVRQNGLKWTYSKARGYLNR